MIIHANVLRSMMIPSKTGRAAGFSTSQGHIRGMSANAANSSARNATHMLIG
jgi:hypothetical protein